MDSKHSRDYKYSAVHGDEPGDDARVNGLGGSSTDSTNTRPNRTTLKLAMGSTLIAAALFLAIGYVLTQNRATNGRKTNDGIVRL